MPDHSTPLWAALPGGSAIKSTKDGEDLGTAIERVGLASAATTPAGILGLQGYRLLPDSSYAAVGKLGPVKDTKLSLNAADKATGGLVTGLFKARAESLPGVGEKVLSKPFGRSKVISSMLGGLLAASSGAVAGDALYDKLSDAGGLSDKAKAAIDVAQKTGAGAGLGSLLGLIPAKFAGPLAKLPLGRGTFGALAGAGAGAAYSGIKQLLNKEANMSYAMLKKADDENNVGKQILRTITDPVDSAVAVGGSLGGYGGMVGGEALGKHLVENYTPTKLDLLKHLGASKLEELGAKGVGGKLNLGQKLMYLAGKHGVNVPKVGKIGGGLLSGLAGAGLLGGGMKLIQDQARTKSASGDRHSTSALALVPILGPSFKSLRDGDTPDQTSTRSVLDAIGSVGGATTGATAAGLLRHKVPQVNIPLLNKVIKAPGLLKTIGIGALVGHGVGSLTADSALDAVIK